MIKLFYSGTYCTRHELINKDNISELLKNDIRSKIVGDVYKTIYPSSGVVIKNNKNVEYIGGFYYEEKHEGKSTCESVVLEELKQIAKCDIVVANLTKYSAIATITEILYAAMHNKKTVIFCDPNITKHKIEGEYWFPILTAKELNKNIEIRYIENEEEIIDYINKLN